MDKIEEKRNKLNLELRSLLSIINMIDGKDYKYSNYERYNMSEEEYLDEQIILAVDAKFRLTNVFKD